MVPKTIVKKMSPKLSAASLRILIRLEGLRDFKQGSQWLLELVIVSVISEEWIAEMKVHFFFHQNFQNDLYNNLHLCEYRGDAVPQVLLVLQLWPSEWCSAKTWLLIRRSWQHVRNSTPRLRINFTKDRDRGDQGENASFDNLIEIYTAKKPQSCSNVLRVYSINSSMSFTEH